MPTTTQNLYGVDIGLVVGPNGTLDLDPNMREVAGTTVLALDCFKRISTWNLFYAPGQTIALSSYLSAGMTDQQIFKIKKDVERVIGLDERVQGVVCASTWDGLSTLTANITVTPNIGPTFTLVVGVTAVNTTLIGVT